MGEVEEGVHVILRKGEGPNCEAQVPMANKGSNCGLRGPSSHFGARWGRGPYEGVVSQYKNRPKT